MGLGDIVDDKKDESGTSSNTGSTSGSTSSRSGANKKAPGNDLFKEVEDFDPESGEVPMCPKCEQVGEQAASPRNGQNLYYYRCTTDHTECDVMQYVYSTRKERYTHTESDPMQKRLIQESEKNVTGEEDSDSGEKESTMEEWNEFLEDVELE